MSCPRVRGRDFSVLCLSVLLTLVVSGCSSFQHEWKRRAAEPAAGASLAGRWEGSWSSDVDRHTGRLRCVVTPLGPDSYRAHFHAVYWKILRFAYAVTLRAAAGTDGRTAIEGDAELGWWAGGRYAYAGEVGPNDFHATYRSRYDHGVFQMRRVEPGAR